jgi:hypothetical protein
VLAFVFAVMAPWYLALPLVLFSSALGILDGLAHRAVLGRQWVAAPAIFGALSLALAVGGAIRGGRGLDVFGG